MGHPPSTVSSPKLGFSVNGAMGSHGRTFVLLLGEAGSFSLLDSAPKALALNPKPSVPGLQTLDPIP